MIIITTSNLLAAQCLKNWSAKIRYFSLKVKLGVKKIYIPQCNSYLFLNKIALTSTINSILILFRKDIFFNSK